MYEKMLICLLALTLIFSSIAHAQDSAWDAPRIDAPYDYSYQDDNLSVAINRIEEDSSVCFVADVQLRDASGFHTAAAAGDFEALSSMAGRAGAVLAINADDYGTHHYGVIIRDGKLIRANDTTRHMLALLPDGSFGTVSDRTLEQPSALADRLAAENVLHTFEFGPILVENGEAVSFPRAFDVISTRESRREPRTAIGMVSPLHYLIIVADGRQPGYSEGLSLQTLQKLFVRYGVQTAINLDGGGSTEMWFQGEILNSPAGGHERKLSDIIWF